MPPLHIYARPNEKSRPKAAMSTGTGSITGAYSVFPVVIPWFRIAHRSVAVPDTRRGRIHDHPDEPQEGQHLVHQLQHQALCHLRENVEQCEHAIHKSHDQAQEASQPDLVLEADFPVQY